MLNGGGPMFPLPQFRRRRADRQRENPELLVGEFRLSSASPFSAALTPAAWRCYRLKLKMKVDFRIAAACLAAVTVAACRAGAPAPSQATADAGDAQRLVALVDYVAGDYALAVRDGVV